MKRFLLVTSLLAVIAIHPSSRCSAQATTGSIEGRVVDPSGLVLPNVEVEVINTQTGVTSKAETDNSGVYLVQALPPGSYQLTLHKDGFRNLTTNAFELHIDQKARVNSTLQVGAVDETVSVTDVAPILQTQGAETGQVIGARQISDLPLLGRNFVDLMLLVPGVVSGSGGNNVNLSVNGQREFGNSIQVNGVEATGNRNNDTNLRPSVDAMEEFKVVTSDYAPELGRASGGAIILQTKAGGNQFHGNLYEFFRPNNTAASEYQFSTSGVNTAPQIKQHNFGGTFGGPIQRDKTFFFLSYEGEHQRNAATYVTSVPTTDEVKFLPDGSADLSGLLGPAVDGVSAPIPIPIYDPFFLATHYYAQQYEGNIIPADQVSPAGKQILQGMFPKPNNSNFFYNNFTAFQRFQFNSHTGNFRMDHVFSPKDRAYLTYDIEQFDSFSGDPYEGAITIKNAGGGDSGDKTYQENQAAGGTWDHVFSPSLLNHFRASYFVSPLTQHSLVDGTRLADKLGIQNANVEGFPDTYGFPQIQFSSGATTGGSTYKPLTFRDQNYQFTEAITWNFRRHNAKFGYEYRYLNSHPNFSLFPVPYQYYSGPYAALTSDSTYSDPNYNALYATGGSEIADLLLGLPTYTFQGLQLTNPHTTSNEHNFYLQDSWQATPKLNLTYGVRYEYQQPYVDANGNASNLDLPTLTMRIAGRGGNSRSLLKSDKNNFAPRLGAAYQLNEKTSVRAGYGAFFSPENDAKEDILTKNYPFFAQNSYTNSPYYLFYFLDTGLARNTKINLTSGQSSIDLTTIPDAKSQTVYYEPQDFPTGYSQMWNLTTQRLLAKDLSIEVGYVGAVSRKLSYSVGDYNVDSHISNKIGKVQALLPSGMGNYNSLQVKVDKRFGHGIGMLASYTYGRAFDNGPAPFDLGGSSGPQDPFNLPAEYAPSDSDVHHNFVMSNAIELPIGRGKWLMHNANSFEQAVFGGWQINSIATLRTGTPVNIVTNASFRNHPGLRPNRVPGQNPVLPRDKRTTKQYFNTAAFTDVFGPGHTPQSDSNPIPGNAGRNLVRGPGYTNEDFSLFKTFQLPEKLALQIRIETFNLLNTTHFGNPNGNRANSFGQISGLTGNPRIMQFAAKVNF